jgi:ATPase subunit of ABC transporter with duplicated ATPase domains
MATFSGTIIAVLHDRYAIARLASRVLELRDGVLREVIADAPRQPHWLVTSRSSQCCQAYQCVSMARGATLSLILLTR